MSQLHQQVADRLTRFYILALAVIAVLSISGLVFIRHTINTHYDDSRIVNVAGRQRMLSQRLTKRALLRTMNESTPDTISFDSLLRIWANTHIQLRNGRLRMEKAYTVRKSPVLDSMFRRIEPYFQSIYGGFRQVNDPLVSDSTKRAALRTILQNEPTFLQTMNDIVFQFDKESFERVRTLERIEWVLTLLTLLTLLTEGLFIFRPVVGYTRKVVWRLDQSEKALQTANQDLAITNQELAQSNQELRSTQAELVRTTGEKYQLQLAEDTVRSAALLEGQEEERRRFARELHDGIGQMLTGIKLHAEKLKSLAFSDEKQRLRFADMCDLIADTIQTTRQVSYNLMPSTLSDFGLAPTLNLLAEQTTRSSGITVEFTGIATACRLNPAVEISLYRIAQEALHNAVKYAAAQTIRITLQQRGHNLSLTIDDNGKGFIIPLSPLGESMPAMNGLENMRTRTRLLNGDFNITSRPKKGTSVRVNIDLSDNAQ